MMRLTRTGMVNLNRVQKLALRKAVDILNWKHHKEDCSVP